MVSEKPKYKPTKRIAQAAHMKALNDLKLAYPDQYMIQKARWIRVLGGGEVDRQEKMELDEP